MRKLRKNEAYPAEWDEVDGDPVAVLVKDDQFSDEELEAFGRSLFDDDDMRARIGPSFGTRQHPRVRRTTCRGVYGWRDVAGPFRTSRAAFRHARKMRAAEKSRFGRSKNKFGVREHARKKGRKTADFSVCSSSTKKRVPAKKTKKAARKPRRNSVRDNPAQLLLRNPSRLKKGKAVDLEELARQDPKFRAALKAYRDFHGEDPTQLERVEVKGVAKLDSPYVWVLGETRASEYEAQSVSARSPGPPFRHTYKPGKQYTAASADGALFVVARSGSNLRVTDRGIED